LFVSNYNDDITGSCLRGQKKLDLPAISKCRSLQGGFYCT